MRALIRTWKLLLIARLLRRRRRRRVFIEYTDTGMHIIHPWTAGHREF